MKIYEFTKPGSFLVIDGNLGNFISLLINIENSFYEANIALNLYLQERKKIEDLMILRFNTTVGEQEDEQDYIRKQEIQRDLLGDNDFFQITSEEREELYTQVEITLKREKWALGKGPRAHQNLTYIIYAKAFIYALDTFYKSLDKLIIEPGAPKEKLEQCKDKFKESFDKLVQARNSAHHTEDRVLGLHHKKKIETKPILGGPIHAPEGGVIVINSMINGNFACTTSDGHLVQVEVSEVSMEKASVIIQEVFNAFTWKGSKQIVPY
ncbi:hypothetical protein [Rufibacter soli]